MPHGVRRTGAEFRRRNRNQKGLAVFMPLFLLLLPLFAFGPRVRRGWLAFWACFAGGVLLDDTPYPLASTLSVVLILASPIVGLLVGAHTLGDTARPF